MATTVNKKTNTKKETKAKTLDESSLSANVYDQAGKETGQISLDPKFFGLKWNSDLVHQVVVSMNSSSRNPIAHTKTRGEVRGGGKKPWKQKGTGRARHGSTRSPIWVGGGVAHGPRNEKNYERKINKTMKSKALFTILSRKFKDNELFFIDSLSFKEAKTKDAKKVLSAWKAVPGLDSIVERKNGAFVLAIPQKDTEVVKSFRNFGNISVEEFRNLNPVSVLSKKGLIIVDPKKTLSMLEGKKVGKKNLNKEK